MLNYGRYAEGQASSETVGGSVVHQQVWNCPLPGRSQGQGKDGVVGVQLFLPLYQKSAESDGDFMLLLENNSL